MPTSTSLRTRWVRYSQLVVVATFFLTLLLDPFFASDKADAAAAGPSGALTAMAAQSPSAASGRHWPSVHMLLEQNLITTEVVTAALIDSAPITEMVSSHGLYLPAIGTHPLPTLAPTYTPPSSSTPQPTVIPVPSATPTATPTSTPLPRIDAYVDAVRGSDANPGTVDQPWKTIQKAADTMWPGSTVLVRAGDYPARVQIRNSGNAQAPITYLAEGEVRMNGFTILANYIAIRGFDISNTADDWKEGWGIFIEGSNCTIENNYVHFATRGGIVTWVNTSVGNPSTTTMYNVIRNNRLYRNGMTGIEVQGRYNLVEGNEISGTVQKHPKASDPPGGGDANGINFHGISNIIRRNYIHDILFGIPENPDPHIDCFQTYADAWHEAAQNAVIEQNLCYNLQAQSLAEMGQGVMIENSKDLIIRNNVFKNYISVYASTTNERLKIYNNTFVSTLAIPPSGMFSSIYLTNSPGTSIKNNIFYDFPTDAITLFDGTSRQGLDVDHNVVYRSDGRRPTGSPYPNDLWGVNPKLADPANGNYKLTSGSPAIDSGRTLPDVSNDYNGATRPQGTGYDIGAFEYPQ